jgi:hypothetical protein
MEGKLLYHLQHGFYTLSKARISLAFQAMKAYQPPNSIQKIRAFCVQPIDFK